MAILKHQQESCETSQERGRSGSDKLKAQQLHAPALEKLSVLLVIVTCVVLQAVFRSEGTVGRFKSTLLTGLEDFRWLLLVMGLELVLQLCTKKCTYLMTAAVVVKDYTLLLMINSKYMCIEIAIIPLIILFFISALASKVKEDDQRREPTKDSVQMAKIPYFLQLSLVIWTQYKGQQGSVFIFSDFLLFFSSVLCELAVMISSLPIGDSPGSAQVLPVMKKTCIIMLLVTAQTMTAEWLGEDIILVCMPELIAVLAWLGIRIHRAGAGAGAGAGLGVSTSSATSGRSGMPKLKSMLEWLDDIHRACLGGSSVVVGIVAFLLSPYPIDESIRQASWLVRLFCISTSCSALSHFHVWLLHHQWPAGSTTNSNGLIGQLLNFSSTIIFRTSRLLCFGTMISMVILYGPWIFILHEATWPAVALLLVSLIFSHEQHRDPDNAAAQPIEDERVARAYTDRSSSAMAAFGAKLRFWCYTQMSSHFFFSLGRDRSAARVIQDEAIARGYADRAPTTMEAFVAQLILRLEHEAARAKVRADEASEIHAKAEQEAAAAKKGAEAAKNRAEKATSDLKIVQQVNDKAAAGSGKHEAENAAALTRVKEAADNAYGAAQKAAADAHNKMEEARAAAEGAKSAATVARRGFGSLSQSGRQGNFGVIGG